MGKVTIVVQHSELPTSAMERISHESLGQLILAIASATENGTDPEVFIVPADEEYPDLG